MHIAPMNKVIAEEKLMKVKAEYHEDLANNEMQLDQAMRD